MDYSHPILEVLNQMQSETGQWYLDRWEINRQIRDKKANIEEIGATIPTEYNVKHWEEFSLSNIYTEIERIRKNNEQIERAQQAIKNRDNKVRAFDAEKEIQLVGLEREYDSVKTNLEKSIIELEAQIREKKEKLGRLDEIKLQKPSIESEYQQT